jgi:hypothetical protein
MTFSLGAWERDRHPPPPPPVHQFAVDTQETEEVHACTHHVTVHVRLNECNSILAVGVERDSLYTEQGSHVTG